MSGETLEVVELTNLAAVAHVSDMSSNNDPAIPTAEISECGMDMSVILQKFFEEWQPTEGMLAELECELLYASKDPSDRLDIPQGLVTGTAEISECGMDMCEILETFFEECQPTEGMLGELECELLYGSKDPWDRLEIPQGLITAATASEASKLKVSENQTDGIMPTDDIIEELSRDFQSHATVATQTDDIDGMWCYCASGTNKDSQ